MTGMKLTFKHGLAALAIAIVLGVTYVMNFGLYPRFFDIAWDEEVKLHDGRVIIVHVKRTFERMGTGKGRWDGTYRDTEISFDAGGKIGRFTRNFERYQVNMIEFKDGNWYFALTDTSGTPPKRIVNEQIPILILNSDGVEQAAHSWDEVPDFPRQNVMPLTPSEEIVQQFSDSILTWERKMAHWQQYPRAAGDNGKIIQRHTKQQGEYK